MWNNLLWHFERNKLVMDTEKFLPTGRVLPRIQQRPENSDEYGHTFNFRFQNKAQDPRNNHRNGQQSGDRNFQKYEQVRNNPRERRFGNEDENNTKQKKSFQKSAASNGSS